MSLATREIKGRLRGIASTRKITKAMELVATAKMRKATEAVLASRTYARLAGELASRLAGRASAAHPLLRRRPVRRVAVVACSGNRGLCGSFNSQLVGLINAQRREWESRGASVELLTFGRRGRDSLLRSGAAVTADFIRPDVLTGTQQLRPLVRLVLDGFTERRWDEVWLAYTDYVSALSQVPRLLPLLPLRPAEADVQLGAVGRQAGPEAPALGAAEYLFEPSPEAVLEAVLPRLVEVMLYQAGLESLASEHAARTAAMRNASEAASDLLDSLSLAFNRARQASITAELADISGGAAALQ